MKPHLNPHHKPVKRKPNQHADARLSSGMAMMPLACLLSGKEAIDLLDEDIRKASHDPRFKKMARGVRYGVSYLDYFRHIPELAATFQRMPMQHRHLIETTIAASCAAVMASYFKQERERPR